MTTREQHEKTAKAFLEALGHADTETMSRLSTDDMTWWIMPGNKFSGTHAKRDYLENIPHLLDNATGPLKLEYDEIIVPTSNLSRTSSVICCSPP